MRTRRGHRNKKHAIFKIKIKEHFDLADCLLQAVVGLTREEKVAKPELNMSQILLWHNRESGDMIFLSSHRLHVNPNMLH